METHACSFYDRDAPIYTMSRFLPPCKVQDAEVRKSILGDGSVIRAGCRINHSVIGLRTLISEGCTVDDALIMGSDYYETIDECALVPGCLPMGLGTLPAPVQLLYMFWRVPSTPSGQDIVRTGPSTVSAAGARIALPACLLRCCSCNCKCLT